MLLFMTQEYSVIFRGDRRAVLIEIATIDFQITQDYEISVLFSFIANSLP